MTTREFHANRPAAIPTAGNNHSGGASSVPADHLPDYVLIAKRRYPFEGFAEASKAYTETIDATGATVSGRTGPLAPHCVFMKRIYGADYCVGHVSYNGNVWSYEPHDLPDFRRHMLVWSPSAEMCPT